MAAGKSWLWLWVIFCLYLKLDDYLVSSPNRSFVRIEHEIPVYILEAYVTLFSYVKFI